MKHRLLWLLIIVGSINWGLVGLGGFLRTNLNVINLVLGGLPRLEWAVYILIGIAGFKLLFYGKKMMMKK